MATIKPKRGSGTPSTGLTQYELAVDTTNKRIYIGNSGGSGDLIGSAPGGSDTQVQFNDSGNLGGDAGLTYNKTTDTLTVTGNLAVNGGDITTTASTVSVMDDASATNATAFRSASTLTFGATTGNTTVRNNLTTTLDLAVNGGDITTSSATATVFNTTATNLSVGGAATTLTMGGTSGTASIRNASLKLGNTTSTITTNTSSSNSITLNPYGNVIVSPNSTVTVGGSRPSLTVENTDGAGGVVEIAGGDLHLGRKTPDDSTFQPVSIVFEGATNDTFETTLTVTDPTADRTITLPDATGTVALVAGSDTQVLFNDGGSALGGDSGLTYNKSTDTLTVTGDVAVNGGDITSTETTFNLLNSTVTTLNIGGATSSTINLGATGGTSTVDLNANIVKDLELRNYYETEGTPTYVGGKTATLTVDLSAANVFTYTTTGSIGTIAVTNIPSKAGTAVGFTVVITCGNALYTVNFDLINSVIGSIKWPGGSPPAATTTVGNTDIVSYTTYDGGTTWYGFVGGLNFS